MTTELNDLVASAKKAGATQERGRIMNNYILLTEKLSEEARYELVNTDFLKMINKIKNYKLTGNQKKIKKILVRLIFTALLANAGRDLITLIF